MEQLFFDFLHVDHTWINVVFSSALLVDPVSIFINHDVGKKKLGICLVKENPTIKDAQIQG